MTTLISTTCPDCGHDVAELLRGLDDDEPDVAVCAAPGCDAEWELTFAAAVRGAR